MADTFGKADVALHSFSEKIDLSSATGRMFYSVLGAFAQFYREQLAENVRMGMQQAVREGKWINRPKTGYDLIDGHLVPNNMAPIARRIFVLRGDGASQGDIARVTGVGYSLVRDILHSRIYLGEVLLNGEWYPGKHEAIITADEFAADYRGRVPGRRRGRICCRVVFGAVGAASGCTSRTTAPARSTTAVGIEAPVAHHLVGRLVACTERPCSGWRRSARLNSSSP